MPHSGAQATKNKQTLGSCLTEINIPVLSKMKPFYSIHLVIQWILISAYCISCQGYEPKPQGVKNLVIVEDCK